MDVCANLSTCSCLFEAYIAVQVSASPSYVYVSIDTGICLGRINEPARCGRQECLAMNSMTLVHNRCRFADKQIVKLQETPHTVSILMHDKLVDTWKPGDRVEGFDQ